MKAYKMLQEYINPDIRASQAQPDDTPAVTNLLVRTAEWIRSLGSTQWQGLLQGEDSHDTPAAIRRGDVFAFKSGDTLVGIMLLFRHPSAWDRELWGVEGHESSIYLHRLAINRDFAGRGLGEQMLRWADSGIEFPVKDRIRLDCMADIPYLKAFYRKAGYTFKGEAANHLGRFNLFEKGVSIDGTATATEA
jgi:ribosomal protein S18 acetylase RimI-like enzyme